MNLKTIFVNIYTYFFSFFKSMQENPMKVFSIILIGQMIYSIYDFYQISKLQKNLQVGMIVKLSNDQIVKVINVEDVIFFIGKNESHNEDDKNSAKYLRKDIKALISLK